MAGDWIKMRKDLFTHPKVVRMSSALKADTLRTVGGLMSVWCLFDSHTEDGLMDGYTPEVVDHLLHWPGFSAAMMSVGWMAYDQENGLQLPNFHSHNGKSAKRRAQDADRKQDVRKVSAFEADEKRTREEKRREDIDTPRKRGNRKSAMPEDFAISERVQTWAQKNGFDHLELHLEHFKSAAKAKGYTYVDWDSAFENAIRQDWAKVRTGKQVNGAASRLDMFRGAL